MSADRASPHEYPAATNFKDGRQYLKIINARSNPGSAESRANLYVLFENPEGTESFFNTVFLTGRPIKTMKIFVIKLYTAAGLPPYVWKDPKDTDEGYEAVMKLVDKTIDAKIGIFRARDGFMRPEITELYDPPASPGKGADLPNPFFDDEIPDLAPTQAAEQVEPQPEFKFEEPKVEPEPEPKLDLKSLAYHMHIIHNYLSEYFLEIYRLLLDRKDTDLGLLSIEAKIQNQFKKIRHDLGRAP